MHLLFKLISKLDFLFLFCSKDALKLPACCKHGAGQVIDFFFFSRRMLGFGFSAVGNM